MIYRRLKDTEDNEISKIISAYKYPEVLRYISIDENNYWSYVTESENVYFYKVFNDNDLVATIHLELCDRILFMDVVVFPEYQRKGVATEVIKDIQAEYFGLDFDKITVSIDESNIPSIKLFEKSGFICVGKDEELLKYEYINPTLG